MFSRLAGLRVKRPSAALLFVQVLSILLYPLMQDAAVQRGMFRVVGLLVVGVALHDAFRRRPRQRRPSPADGAVARHDRGVLGVMYIALAVSRLIALSVTTRSPR